MMDLKSLRKTLEELTENKPSEQYVGDCAYHEGYRDGQIDLATELLSQFFPENGNQEEE